MCRFVAYLGEPILAEDLITKPENSLIHQSFGAKEMDEPLNGDGFGLGWYVKNIREDPGVFKSITPAWNNQNLKQNTGIIKSNCFFAHIRAASEGIVAENNTHPFHYKKYMMMHNGGIYNFKKIKRDLINLLSDDYYQWINGETDSEHIFALMMQNTENANPNTDVQLSDMAEAFKKTFLDIEAIKAKNGLTEPSLLNMVVTDGYRMIATRYSSAPEKESRTLYYTHGEKYVCEGNVCRMLPPNSRSKSMLVVSEKLDGFVDEWVKVPDNNALLVNADLSYELLDLN